MMWDKSNIKGFTLVEVLVTLLIISSGMLALGSFYATSISEESISQERLAAVHMAEQLIEDWQKTNEAPTPDCQDALGNPAGQLTIGTEMLQCRANIGVAVKFDILINEVDAQAPIPPAHPNNPNSSGVGNSIMGTLFTRTDPTDPVGVRMDPASPLVKVRSVRIKWQHKGKVRKVVLTHITRFGP